MKAFKIMPFLAVLLLGSCEERRDNATNEQAFVDVLETHLKAVSEKDVETLKTTLSPKGNMQFIMQGAEIMYSVDSFVKHQAAWYKDPSWTFETKVLNTEVGDRAGFAVVEIVYSEPNRTPEPYFNRMIISYGLEKIDGRWYVVKDHASSVEKSTDKTEED